MRRAFLTICALLLAACGQKPSLARRPTPPRTHEDLRAANVAAYEAARERLLRDSAGQWTLIVRGIEVHVSADTFEAACARADALAPDDSHRFIWRPGTDDARREFYLSPWVDKPGEQGNWMQLGIAFVARVGVRETFSPSVGTSWSLNGRERSWSVPGVSRVTLKLQAPCGPAEEDADIVSSKSFVHDITLTPEIAARLGVERAAIPGSAFAAGGDKAWRLAWVRVKEPTLGIDEMAVGFIVPPELWAAPESR